MSGIAGRRHHGRHGGRHQGRDGERGNCGEYRRSCAGNDGLRSPS
jgi:hypothetical protein